MSTYNPPRFEIKNHQHAIEFMIKNSFATVISVVGNEPLISQVPITVVQNADEVFLVGHFARQNPHANAISKSQTTVLFHGAHTYITPVWYAENDVPTWNYSSGWNFFIPADLQGEVLQKSIVGFKIKVKTISFKQKLSQNRSALDRAGILKGLAQRTDQQSQQVLTDMLHLYHQDGSRKP